MASSGDSVGINRVTLRLMGEDYIVTGTDTAEYIEHLGEYLNQRMEQINDSAVEVKLSKAQLAILAALQVTDEFHKLQQEHEELLQLIKEAK